MPSFAEAVVAINELKDAKLIDDYAVGGAMAALFWTEAIPTFDLDVFVLFPIAEGALIDLGPIYAWAADRHYPVEAEHIVIGVTERSNAATEERLKTGHAVGGVSIV